MMVVDTIILYSAVRKKEMNVKSAFDQVARKDTNTNAPKSTINH